MKKIWFVQRYTENYKTNFRASWNLEIYFKREDIPKNYFIEDEVTTINVYKDISLEKAKERYIKDSKEFWKDVNWEFFV